MNRKVLYKPSDSQRFGAIGTIKRAMGDNDCFFEINATNTCGGVAFVRMQGKCYITVDHDDTYNDFIPISEEYFVLSLLQFKSRLILIEYGDHYYEEYCRAKSIGAIEE